MWLKSMEKTNWLEGRIKEVATLYHRMFGISDITYSLCPDKVEFYSDGLYFAVHKKNKTR